MFKKRPENGEPSFFRKLLEIYYERAQARKARRILVKQEWSINFLVALLVKAREVRKSDVHLTLENGSQKVHITAAMALDPGRRLFTAEDAERAVKGEALSLDEVLEDGWRRGLL